MMDLNGLNLFVNVVRYGSFSGAARKLQVPVATISRRVAELEAELGIRLLERSTRKQRLTEAGSLLMDYAERGLRELDHGQLALRNQQLEPVGTLRLSLPPNFEVWWPLLRAFQGQYPGIKIRVMVTNRRIDMIADGIDVVLRVGDVGEDSAVVRRLISYAHLVVASPDFLAKQGQPLEPASLKDFPCAVWCTEDLTSSWILGGIPIPIRPYFGCNDYAHLLSLALAGDCITELPPFLLKEHLASGRLVHLLKDWPMGPLPLHLVYPSRTHLSRLVRLYVDFCLAWSWKEFLPPTGPELEGDQS